MRAAAVRVPDAAALSAGPVEVEKRSPRPASKQVVDSIAVARLYGEPLFDLPHDLYIPPDALEVFLEAFEGPLDLLLYLIRRQNFNILDIPLASVTRQYLAYVEQIRTRNLELAADYLLMAAMLIEIKSRMLLPPQEERRRQGARRSARRARAPADRVRADEARRRPLDALPLLGRDFQRAQVADRRVGGGAPAGRRAGRPAQRLARHPGARQAAPAPPDLARAPERARAHERSSCARCRGAASPLFEELFDVERGAPVVVVTFIALLELAREHLLEVTQAEAFAPIYVRLAYQPA